MKDYKKYIHTVVTVVVTVVVIYIGYKAYDYAYKRGFEAGAKNQLICAAGEKDATLKILCK